jgi:hypothetical protein
MATRGGRSIPGRWGASPKPRLRVNYGEVSPAQARPVTDRVVGLIVEDIADQAGRAVLRLAGMVPFFLVLAAPVSLQMPSGATSQWHRPGSPHALDAMLAVLEKEVTSILISPDGTLH